MGHQEHSRLSKDTPVRCAILTVSDTRTTETDSSGSFIRGSLSDAGLPVVKYRVVVDDATAIREAVLEFVSSTDVLLITGGTGVSRRDTTYEVVRDLYGKTLNERAQLLISIAHPDDQEELERAWYETRT